MATTKNKDSEIWKNASYLCNICKKWYKYKDYVVNEQKCKKCLQKTKK